MLLCACVLCVCSHSYIIEPSSVPRSAHLLISVSKWKEVSSRKKAYADVRFDSILHHNWVAWLQEISETAHRGWGCLFSIHEEAEREEVEQVQTSKHPSLLSHLRSSPKSPLYFLLLKCEKNMINLHNLCLVLIKKENLFSYYCISREVMATMKAKSWQLRSSKASTIRICRK